ncbi:MAG: DUF2851 family protein [Flavobacteriaceae bacterium]|nr:DUF2851 family protein [Flavobacteriaceae bacterium]
MQEDFFHYLWKYKFFAIKKLQTITNIPLQIINVGEHNLNSGPDFFNANIKIGNQFWAGNVEIHVKSSDWYLHKHENDTNYDNVILHVVWKYDAEVYGKDNQEIPTLELNQIVSTQLINQYQTLFSKQLKWINCENQFNTVNQFTLNNWLEVLYFERLEQKSNIIQNLLQKSANDWEAVLFQLLAKNFGLKVNGEAFLNLANSIDFKTIRKEHFKLINIEALFFGQAGFLEEEIESAYYKQLQKEYKYLQLKYKLEPLYKGQFHFFRLRPNNFPTIRLAQLAILYFSYHNLFSKIVEAKTLDDYYTLFTLKISNFWQQHYSFTSSSVKRSKKITKSFIDLLIINTIIPLKFVYFKQMGKLGDESILSLIKQIQPEKNSIIKKYESLPFEKENLALSIDNAFESQSFLQLKNEYCNSQRCLHCAIGNSLLKT